MDPLLDNTLLADEGLNNSYSKSSSTSGFTFAESGSVGKHRALLREKGYEINVWVSMDKEDPDYTTIWIITKKETGHAKSCKASSLKITDREKYTKKVESVRKEAKILQLLNHNHVIKIIEEFGLQEPDSGFPNSFFCIVMELTSGDLKTYAYQHMGHHLPEDSSKVWMKEITSAVKYLHNGIGKGLSVSHLAIKPSNILFKWIDESHGLMQYKLINFEESVLFEATDVDRYPTDWSFKQNQFTPPEAKQENGGASGKATKPMDVFSLGKTLLLTLCGCDPRRQRLELAKYANQRNGVFQLITAMMSANPNLRPDIGAIGSHPWLQ